MEKKEKTFLLCGLAAIILAAPFIKNKIKEIKVEKSIEQDLANIDKHQGWLKLKITRAWCNSGKALAKTKFEDEVILKGVPIEEFYEGRTIIATFVRSGVDFYTWKEYHTYGRTSEHRKTVPCFTFIKKEA